MSEANKDTVRRLVSAFNQGKEAAVAAVSGTYARDYVYHRGTKIEFHGRDEARAAIETFFDGLSPMTFEIDDLRADGDMVAGRYHIRGRHSGPMMGIAATGREVEFDSITFSRIAGGWIAEDWELSDEAELLRQIGGPAEANKALVRRWWDEGLNGGNLKLIDELFDPAYTAHLLSGGEVRGREELGQFVETLNGALPGRYTIENVVAEGDWVVTRWSYEGAHQGELLGVAPTGRKLVNSGIAMVRIAGGRIVEDFETWDVAGIRKQLGVEREMALFATTR